jgi:hypothetical protein
MLIATTVIGLITMPETGATNLMSWEKEKFDELKAHESSVKVGDGRSLSVKGIGNLKMNTICLNYTIVEVTIYDVLYVPDLGTNLISMVR